MTITIIIRTISITVILGILIYRRLTKQNNNSNGMNTQYGHTTQLTVTIAIRMLAQRYKQAQDNKTNAIRITARITIQITRIVN